MDGSNEDWKNRPTIIESWPNEITHVVFMDENGSAELNSLKRAMKRNVAPDDGSKFFNLAACIMSKDSFFDARDRFLMVKHDFWQDGMFPNRKTGIIERVCFHTSEINKGHNAFNGSVINRQDFFNRLTDEIDKTDMCIVDSYINKVALVNKYAICGDPYELATEFILERIVTRVLNHNETAIIILESRGKDADRALLKYLVKTIQFGTRFVDSEKFKKIKGIFFNPKYCKDKSKSYIGLEIAALCAYPIFKWCKFQHPDQNFTTLRKKLLGSPNRIAGLGIKIFP